MWLNKSLCRQAAIFDGLRDSLVFVWKISRLTERGAIATYIEYKALRQSAHQKLV